MLCRGASREKLPDFPNRNGSPSELFYLLDSLVGGWYTTLCGN